MYHNETTNFKGKNTCNKMIHFIIAMYYFVIIFWVTEVSSIVAELCN